MGNRNRQHLQCYQAETTINLNLGMKSKASPCQQLCKQDPEIKWLQQLQTRLCVYWQRSVMDRG